MEMRYTADRNSYRRMTSDELRDSYLIGDLFTPGTVSLTYTDVDRAVVGSIVPLGKPLTLPTHKELAAEYFAERREIGVINIGAAGSVTVDGETYVMNNRDSLYIARGSRAIEFHSSDATTPALFYLLSYPAHTSYKTNLVPKSQAKRLEMGTLEDSNKRIIYQSIRPGIVETCQIVMGFTELDKGSVWNTFPPHTHRRRSEVYMYFDLSETSRVFHFMGEPNETRSIVLKNGDAVISPSWSVHSGCGSRNYTFIWGMGGENQEFTDMDGVDINLIK
ncbi:5-dehydro-4-deoxy-D-glucuronate isomerase [Paremcibacter congregatus]|uniref:5-dehydro-4-deoxy-D-glucuronate isomerase n=1 Tax=Paremcibacter congregatus TaxID=2043170 RepID=UPI003A8E9854